MYYTCETYNFYINFVHILNVLNIKTVITNVKVSYTFVCSINNSLLLKYINNKIYIKVTNITFNIYKFYLCIIYVYRSECITIRLFCPI